MAFGAGDTLGWRGAGAGHALERTRHTLDALSDGAGGGLLKVDFVAFAVAGGVAGQVGEAREASPALTSPVGLAARAGRVADIDVHPQLSDPPTRVRVSHIHHVSPDTQVGLHISVKHVQTHVLLNRASFEAHFRRPAAQEHRVS